MGKNNQPTENNLVEQAAENTQEESIQDTTVEVVEQAPTEAPTQAPTEAVTASPTQAPTQAPTTAPTQAPTVSPAKTAKVNQTNTHLNTVTKDDSIINPGSDFNERIAQLKVSGTPEQKFIISEFEMYLSRMQPGLQVSVTQGAKYQEQLWKAINTVIESHDRDFKASWSLILAFFHNYANHAFHLKYLYRFNEQLAMPREAITLMEGVYAIITVTANPEERQVLKKEVDINRAMRTGISEKGRSKLLNFYRV